MENYDYSEALSNSTGSTAGSVLSTVLMIAGLWFLFVKANEDGWKAIIPFYNAYTLYDIVYGNGLKALLLLVPILNIGALIMLPFRIAKVFGKGVIFGIIGLFLLPVELLLIAFTGNSNYQGPCSNFI